jgi:hypothetical protein
VPSLEVVANEVVWGIFWKVFRRSCGSPTRSVGPTEWSAGLLVGRTHLSGTAVSMVGGDPGVPMSHNFIIFLSHVTYLVQATKRLLSLARLWMSTQPNNDTLHAQSLAGGRLTMHTRFSFPKTFWDAFKHGRSSTFQITGTLIC